MACLLLLRRIIQFIIGTRSKDFEEEHLGSFQLFDKKALQKLIKQ